MIKFTSNGIPVFIARHSVSCFYKKFTAVGAALKVFVGVNSSMDGFFVDQSLKDVKFILGISE